MEQETVREVTVTETKIVRQGTRDWSTGICDCCSDVKSCICTLLCLPCKAVSIANRVDESCACCAICCCPGGLLALRTKVRTMYGIKGSICMDAVCTELFAPCVVCQMDRELKAMGV